MIFLAPFLGAHFGDLCSFEHLIVGVCLAVLGLLSLYSALFIYTIGIVFALWFISIMALTLPNLGAMVRRLHDTNNSEWLLLLGFIPYIAF